MDDIGEISRYLAISRLSREATWLLELAYTLHLDGGVMLMDGLLAILNWYIVTMDEYIRDMDIY